LGSDEYHARKPAQRIRGRWEERSTLSKFVTWADEMTRHSTGKYPVCLQDCALL